MKNAFYILAELSDRDFEWLTTHGKRRDISAGTILIYENEPTDALYLILDGCLEVTAKALEGQELARLSKGEVVGEMSFIDTRPPSATVKAVEDSVVWAIPRSQLTSKLLHDVAFASHFYYAIAVFLSDRMRGTVSRLGQGAKEEQVESAEAEADMNPEMLANLELAKVRLDWLLNRLRDAQ